MSRRYKGAVISATPPTTTGGEDGTAPGEWTLQSQAQAQAAGLWPTPIQPKYIEDVFSTYLYTGNSSTQTITNGLDLSTKGGLVWLKSRTGAYGHNLMDTARGMGSLLESNTTAAQQTGGYSTATTTGFSINVGYAGLNQTGSNYASWTFRKQPKFFDIVTWTGNGASNRQISHNLQSVPGAVIVKCTSTTSDWNVAMPVLGDGNALLLNSFGSLIGGRISTLTSTTFQCDFDTYNVSGATYVAYVFASNAGGFGLLGTDNIITCGSYTGTGSAGLNITLGYEPQWILIKNASSNYNWVISDTMRGMDNSSSSWVYANTTAAEASNTPSYLIPTATGFTVNTSTPTYNASGSTYIYIAIRRGPMKVPTDGTKVFTPVTDAPSANNTAVSTGNRVDMLWSQAVASSGGDNESYAFDRLRGSSVSSQPFLKLSGTGAETTQSGQGMGIAQNTGYIDNWFYWNYGGGRTIGNWAFSRAPSFFDEVCYTGTGTSGTAIPHNLGVAPELIISKARSTTNNWLVWATALGNQTSGLLLNTTDAVQTVWASGSSPTSSNVYVNYNVAGNSSVTYVAYLFATCAGVSKVGSYTGTGATQTINCGFTGGARFVMIKRTDSTGDWYIWDTARGMVAGTDPYLLLNTQSSQVNANNVYTATTGFQIVGTGAGFNANGGSYIFLAIA